MKKLKELTGDFEHEIIAGAEDTEISALVYDSRKICEGCVFVCIKGMKFDGHDAAQEALLKGAAALVVSHEIDVQNPQGTAIVKTDDTRLALACMSAAWFDHPARKLTTIGVTGTKGKTTTTYLIKSILDRAHGRGKTGLVGTIETIIGDERTPSANTTPESYVLQETFRKMVDAGVDTVVMEASSQGFMMHRVAGFRFDYGMFTNIEPDHIGPGEHRDFDDYLRCKSMVLRQCRFGIVNGDDEHVDRVKEGMTCESLISYGLDPDRDLAAENVKVTKKGGELGVSFTTRGMRELQVYVSMPGRFSVYNALGAIAVCAQLGIEDEHILGALSSVRVKGRTELCDISDRFSLMIDYAHNAMALESLLKTLREYGPGRLVCLFGCGGNRSKIRRYEMGEVSGRLADLTVITSDNPRNEEPMDIIADIVTGIKKTDGSFVEIPDRREAIRYVIENAKDGDVIVLAGKGHEDYQEICGKKYHMDEREIIDLIVSSLPAYDKRLMKSAEL